MSDPAASSPPPKTRPVGAAGFTNVARTTLERGVRLTLSKAWMRKVLAEQDGEPGADADDESDDARPCLVLVRHAARTVRAYTPAGWTRHVAALEEKFASASIDDDEAALMHQLLTTGFTVPVDRHGRMAIPDEPRRWAGLAGDVVVRGRGEFLELLDAARFDEEQRATERLLEDRARFGAKVKALGLTLAEAPPRARTPEGGS